MPEFGILLGGSQIATFSELQGITTEVRTVDYDARREDPVQYLNRFTCIPASLPSRTNLPTSYQIKLVKRSDGNARLRSWHQQAVANQLTGRKDCILEVHSSDNKPVARYHLENAWPSKFEPLRGFTTAAAAGAGAVAMETVTIAVEKIDLVR